MKVSLIAFTVFLFIICSCSDSVSEKKTEPSKSSINDSISIDRWKVFKFKNEEAMVERNEHVSKNIQGVWFLNGDKEITLLETKLKPPSKVVFLDSTNLCISVWGELMYRSTAKFYSTEHISDMFEYYVNENNRLVLTKYNYYNDDLSFKERPTLDTLSFPLSIQAEKLIFYVGGDKFELTKGK